MKLDFNIDFDYSEEKNKWLQETRGVTFEDVKKAISKGNILENKRHPNIKKYNHQWQLIVQMKGYLYIVPYVFDRERNVIFLKTIYPSRVAVKNYRKGEK